MSRRGLLWSDGATPRRRLRTRSENLRVEGTTIRRLPLLLALLLALSLAACGTWDPTAQEEPEATRSTVVDEADDPGSTGGMAELTVGDGTFNFNVTDCFANPDEGVRFTGTTDDGTTIEAQYDPEAPEDATVVVTNSEGVELYTANRASADAAPEFQMTEDGFQASGAFVSDTDEAVEGSFSGTC